MSLRKFHLAFIVLVVIGADLFGAWTVREYMLRGDSWILSLGVAVVLGGFGLIVYAWRLVKRLDEADIR